MQRKPNRVTMTITETAEFDINGAKPFSRNALVSIEASAGTGKTYSLTTTVVRLVAEQGIRADQILLMTFTNEATGELRLETRRRCREALAALSGVGKAAPWMQHMQATEVRDVAIERLEEFLARYDEVTISTIHGFCQSVLRQAGLDGEAPANFQVAPNIDGIIDQAITDLLAGRLSENASCLYGTKWVKKRGEKDAKVVPTTISNVASTLNNLREVVKTILNNEGAELLPARSGTPLGIAPVKDGISNGTSQFEIDTLAQTIADTARAVVDEVRERCLRAGIVTYNDIVRLVAQALNSPAVDGRHLADQLASQYPIVMIDEFQDTDAVQWQIFGKIFEAGRGKLTLITVGDPKQAIYRFRGADVNVYLAASKKADESFDLRTNRRSDAPLLKALEVILENETFDVNGDVTFKPVNADVSNKSKMTYQLGVKDGVDAEANVPSTPMEIRWIPRSSSFEAKDKDPEKGIRRSNNAAEAVRTAFFSDMAARVVDILNWATIPDSDATDGSPRAVKPSDIAILVDTHAEAREAVRSLQKVHVGAVKLKTGSVFQTEAARHWLMLLKALANPGRPRDVRTYALSWFGGLDEDSLLGDVKLVIDLQRRCANHAELMQREGVTALYMAYRSSAEFLTNVLYDPDGLRNLTDLDHIAEALGSMPEFATSAGPLECLDVLSDLIDNADGDADEQKRRIDTDHESVTVMTIHSSKGLQFPIVILPTLNHIKPRRGALMFPAKLADGVEPVRVIDVASPFGNAQKWIFKPTSAGGGDIARMETRGDDETPRSRFAMTAEDIAADARRLFYVAMTRAKHKLICYWSPIGQGDPKDPFSGSIARAADLKSVPLERDDLRRAFDTLVAKSNGSISHIEITDNVRKVELVEKMDGAAGTAPDDGADVATFERASESVAVYGYGRWSYSTVTKGLKSRALLGRREAGAVALPGASDESNTEDDDAVSTSNVSPFAWAGLPAGAGFGNDIHTLLDRIDPAATDLGEELDTVITEIFPAYGAGLDRTRLASAIAANLVVKLADGFEGRSLVDLGRKHRLSELRFDFPLPRNSSVGVHELVGLAVKYGHLPKGVLDDFERMVDAMSGSARIAGFMNGSIDAVFRISGDQPRYIVCDYKTNKLHKDNDPNPIESYGRASMEDAMLRDGFFFQAMIYSVALHRYLRQRQPGYEFDKHFGGVSYLFLRGLDGSIDASGYQRGNYFWKPSKALIDGLDTLFTETTQ
jgi:exodeoxyribonuclease V beta subunit